MEPIDFDKIIQEKLQEESSLHEHEIEMSRPFVWSAIQKNIGKKNPWTWYHQAAAIILLMISFSFVMLHVQNNHQKELIILSKKIEQLEKVYANQAFLIQTKEKQVESVRDELRKVEMQFASLQQTEPVHRSGKIVNHRDTVYVKQIEYITTISNSDKIMEEDLTPVPEQPETMLVQGEERKKDDVIFPSNSELGIEKDSESLKIKFGSFASLKN